MIELLLGAAITFNVCWQAPTENVDGTPISGLAYYTIFWGDFGSRVYNESLEIPANLSCYDVPTAEALTYYVALTVTDNDGDESGYSNEVLKTSSDPAPLPPGITLDEQTVYTLIKQPNRFLLLPIGTVSPGTPCDMNNMVNGLAAVPTSAVIWTSPTGPRPIVVVAQCDG